MSYAAFGFGYYGALGTTAADCGPGSSYNRSEDACLCNVGLEENPGFIDNPKLGCRPISLKASCPPGQFRNPIDKQCTCPPGTIISPDPTRSDCVPSVSWFPNCKDVLGNKIPNCLFGSPLKDVALYAGGGVVAGVVLCAFVGALLR